MNKIKFLYFSSETLQVPRVARQCMVSLCEGISYLGVASEIVSYKIKMHPSEPKHPPLEKLYLISAPIKHTVYPLIGIEQDSRSPLRDMQRLFFYFVHILRLILNSEFQQYRYVIVSARNYSVLAMLVFFKYCLKRPLIVIADIHGIPATWFAKWILRIVDGNFCISRTLSEDLKNVLSLKSYKVSFAHSGVKLERFVQIKNTKEQLRSELKLPYNKKILCYTGKVYYRYPEIGYFLDIAQHFNDEIYFLIVGGRPDQLCSWKNECYERNISNIIFKSFVPPSEIPKYLKAADLLIMYYSPSVLSDYRSPGKLFEYMASGTPFIAPRTRSIEEIVHDNETAILVEPYKPELVVLKIQQVFSNGKDWHFVGNNAIERVKEYAWPKRSQCLLEYAFKLITKS